MVVKTAAAQSFGRRSEAHVERAIRPYQRRMHHLAGPDRGHGPGIAGKLRFVGLGKTVALSAFVVQYPDVVIEFDQTVDPAWLAVRQHEFEFVGRPAVQCRIEEALQRVTCHEPARDRFQLAPLRGIETGLSGEEPAISQEEAMAVQQAFGQRLQAKREGEMQAAAKKNREDGEAFMAANKSKPGVQTTESGLQYKVETQGEGPRPAATDTVKVHYTGTLLDGTKFDSSVDRGEPAQFALNQVIPGWTEALQLMPVGSKYTLWLPSELAYGENGTPGPIGPNATLMFEVELIEIVQAAAAAE